MNFLKSISIKTYDFIEPNNLKGLQPGFVVAQANPAGVTFVNGKFDATQATETFTDAFGVTRTVVTANNLVEVVNGYGVVANGQLAVLNANGYAPYAQGNTSPLYVTYTEPRLVSKVLSDANFAADVAHDPARLVQLIPGDEFTTTIAPTDDRMADAISDGRIAVISKKYINPTDGTTVVETNSTYATGELYNETTFADGTPCYSYVFIK